MNTIKQKKSDFIAHAKKRKPRSDWAYLLYELSLRCSLLYHYLVAGYYGLTLDVRVSVRLSVRLSFSDDNE